MTLLYRKLNYKEYKRGKVDAKGWNECGKGWERREKERRRSPGTKNKASFVAVARGAIRPAFQLTGRRCFRVQPCRKLDLFTRRLRSEPRRTEARHDKFQKSIPLPNEPRLFRLAPPKTRSLSRRKTALYWRHTVFECGKNEWRGWSPVRRPRHRVDQEEKALVAGSAFFSAVLPFARRIPIRRGSLLSSEIYDRHRVADPSQ